MTNASTMNSTSTGGFTETALDAFTKGRDEPAWLAARRREALAIFQASPWPTLRDEEWRRTDIRAFKLANFHPPESNEPNEAEKAALRPAYDNLNNLYGTGVEQINAAVTRRPEASLLPKGVIFTDLASAVREHPELVRQNLLTRAVDPSADVFSALHSAFWTGGVFLYVPKGVKVETPLFSLIGLAGEGSVDLNHTLVVLEDGAEATLVQETTSAGRPEKVSALHAGAVELIVGQGAHLRFVNIQNWDDQTWHFSRDRAIVERDASVQWTIGGLGSRLAKVNQEVALTGPGAQAQVNGIMFTTGRQHLAYFTRQDHAAPNTRSDLLYKGGLKGHSRIVWKGMIRVEPEAQKTDAYQKNDSLVLADTARADSIPGLEIEANDVRCTHGATAGQVDEDMVFYLQARGIGREEAVRLVVEGFFANVYDRITLEPVRETLRQAVAEKLGR
ncbi:MAG TPA: Fe-S cluster assembly protein SufD [Isosphaeraceae bacterium]|nr:Fe-S cluster assembly protein SufD [Isosphaeraceae bacterium]